MLTSSSTLLHFKGLLGVHRYVCSRCNATHVRDISRACSRTRASDACVHGSTHFFSLSLQVPAQYNTQYAVNDEYSGNNYGHQKDRDGYKTQGTYYVQLPEGRLQKVTYYVDGESGYVAEVTYEGEAQYPAYQPSLSTSYQPAPSPSYA
ncbi:uncharacterized protein LOC119586929 [Penaeus monodon]|uniref:uncharacterized protein LOC119586929 n=1 Tax=Penaeus monodon TaxID=6687 RepID=UPI0018A76C98|nr:uncharacterized protein LOC119586929 [Penaeus monodon]